MAEIVNLRRVRRARARAAAAEDAASARARHGVPPAQRRAADADRLREDDALERAKLTLPPDVTAC